ncbi:MAG: cell wall hydrolase [Pseudomonadota bacterium]
MVRLTLPLILAIILAGCEAIAPLRTADGPSASSTAEAPREPRDASRAVAPAIALDGPLTLASLALPLSSATAVALDPAGRAPLDDPISCLARTLYWEAKGEGERGMRAVAHVVANRVASPRFPDTYCGVVTAGGQEGPCQFSWWCDGRPDEVVEAAPFATAREISREVLNGTSKDPTDGATFFHNRSVSPSWSRVFPRTARIGAHIFYRGRG